MNMPAGQNRSNCVFRNGFLRLATMPTAQSGFKSDLILALPDRGEYPQSPSAGTMAGISGFTGMY